VVQLALILAITVIKGLTTVAQEVQCKATLSSLPAAVELKGFHLGMTMEQVKLLVPTIVFGPTDALGGSKTTINPGYDQRPGKSDFEDVRSVSLDFLDGHLVSLWIGYDQTFKWKGVDDFVQGISKSLSLPENWSSWKTRGKELTCSDFQLTVSLIAQSPSLRIVDRAADELYAARRQAKEAETEAAAEQEEDNSVDIIGDSKAKVYFSSGCIPSKQVTETNRVVFKNIAEAEKAGYARSRLCVDSPP
jgi:hypothetical protein